MRGLVPRIHVLLLRRKTWMAVTSTAMTQNSNLGRRNSPAVCRLTTWCRRRSHGEESKTQIRPQRRQGRRKRNAPLQARHGEKRSRRKRRQGEKPQAGDRHRSVEGPQEGQEGPAQDQALGSRLSGSRRVTIAGPLPRAARLHLCVRARSIIPPAQTWQATCANMPGNKRRVAGVCFRMCRLGRRAVLANGMEIEMEKIRTHWVEMMATSVTAVLLAFGCTVLAGLTLG